MCEATLARASARAGPVHLYLGAMGAFASAPEAPPPPGSRLVRVLYCAASGRARADALARELAALAGARRRLASAAAPPSSPPLAVEARPFPPPLLLQAAGAALNALVLVAVAALLAHGTGGTDGALAEGVRRFGLGALAAGALGLIAVREAARSGAFEVELVEAGAGSPPAPRAATAAVHAAASPPTTTLLWSRLGRGAGGASQKGITPDAEQLLELIPEERLPPRPSSLPARAAGAGGAAGAVGGNFGGGGGGGGGGFGDFGQADAAGEPRRRAAIPAAQQPWTQRRPE